MKLAFKKFSKYFNKAIGVVLLLLGLVGLVKYEGIKSYVQESLYEIGYKLEEIQINDLQFLDVKEVVDIMNVQNEESVFKINIEEIEINLERNFWISEAKVRVIYPNILNVFITEKVPEFLWNDGKKFYAVNEKGEILKQVLGDDKYQFANFITISGKNSRGYIPNLMLFIKSDDYLFSNISAISRVGKRRWDVYFIGGLKVMLPQKTPAKSWQNFIELNDKINFFNNKFKSVDLRVENKIFIEKK
jgi:cell division protein FtsQ